MNTPCPDVDALEQHAVAASGADDDRNLSDHISHCSACQSRLAEISENLRLAADVQRVMQHDADPADETCPEVIGGYRIIREIGRGGMGVVYLAEQANPRRQVALKVIRPESGGESLIRRFEREAEVLARLQHPGIAQVFEAGVADSPSGAGRSVRRPFLVMEYIQGQPLDAYASRRGLRPRERLELMADVADAVHHAHVHGVIHRDLKPGNILVQAPHTDSSSSHRSGDRIGRPKILDFGVARITEADLQAVTLQTNAGQLVGTVPYMSPEQVIGDARELDHRSDVYALGVITYEMLCGRLPHDVRNCIVPEAVRRIRDDDPTPLSEVDRSLRGDVATIVAKAIEKDRTRRYASAEAFAADIRRYLRDEPIVARPAGTLYQLGKFARRNQALVGGVMVAFVALAVGFAAAVWEARAATRARDAALEQTEVAKAVNAFVEDMLAAVDPRNLPDRRDITVREALDQAAAQIDAGALHDQPKTEAGVRAIVGNTYRALGMLPQAERQLDESVRIGRRAYAGDDESLAFSLHKLALVISNLGRYAEAEALGREALEMRLRLFGEKHAETLKSMNNLAQTLFDRGDRVGSEALHRKTLALRRELLGDQHTQVANSLNNLAIVIGESGRREEAVSLYRESLEIDLAYHGEEHPHVAITMGNLAAVLQEQGELGEAESMLSRALELQRRTLGPEHPSVAITTRKMADLHMARGNDVQAERLLRECIDLQRRTLGERHPEIAHALTALANFLQRRGATDETERLLDEALAIRLEALGEDHRDTLLSAYRIAVCGMQRGDFTTAEMQLADVVARARRALPTNDMYTILFLREHGQALACVGSSEGAEAAVLEAYDIISALYGDETPATRHTASIVSGVYELIGRPKDAAEWRARAIPSATTTAPAGS